MHLRPSNSAASGFFTLFSMSECSLFCFLVKNLLYGLFSRNYLWDQKDWHYKWKTSQNKDILIKIQKRLPEEVRYKMQSFHLSVCFGMLTGDKIFTVMAGREEVVGIPTDILHTCDSHQRWGWHFKQKVPQVPVLLHLRNAHVIAAQTCRQSRNLCQRQAESWTAQATHSASQGCSTFCADFRQNRWLYAHHNTKSAGTANWATWTALRRNQIQPGLLTTPQSSFSWMLTYNQQCLSGLLRKVPWHNEKWKWQR